MVEFLNISKSFGQTKALQDINLKINRGELFGLIGPDGAGKTTLFRILATLLLPDQGSSTVFDLDGVKDYRKIRNIIGYMPGRFSLYSDLTVLENLNFYATIYGTTIAENYDRIKLIYSQIEPFKDRLAKKLSGGMKQKLALCCALVHDPELLVLDEPTTGVDAVSRKEFWEMLAELKKGGLTIIVSTPYMDEAKRCDRVALIQRGKILACQPPMDIIAGFPGKIYAAQSDQKYDLLLKLRESELVKSAFMFGQDIHFRLNNDDDFNLFSSIIKDIQEMKIDFQVIVPDIEDCFLELASQNIGESVL